MFRAPARDYYETTPEEHAARDAADAEAGVKARKAAPLGGKSKALKALSNPAEYHKTGEGNPKVMLEQALADMRARHFRRHYTSDEVLVTQLQ